MKILGIDPGTGRIGYGVLTLSGSSEVQFVDCGLISVPKAERPARLSAIHSEVQNLIQTHQPDLMVIEKLFFNKNLKTAMAVGEAIGVILLAAENLCVPIREYTPLQVKEVVVGSGRAKKHEVKGMMEIVFDRKIEGPDDVADALAVAYCHLSLEALGL